MDELLILAGYDLQRSQRRPMAASKSRTNSFPAAGATTNTTTSGGSGAGLGSAGAGNDAWDWDQFGLNSTSSPSADISVDPIFGSFGRKKSSPPSSRGGDGDVFGDFGAFNEEIVGKRSSGFDGFDLMSSGVGDDVLESIGKSTVRPLGGKGSGMRDGGFEELIPGFGVSVSSSNGAKHVGGLESLGKAMPESKGGSGSGRGNGEGISGFDELIPGMGSNSNQSWYKFMNSGYVRNCFVIVN